jgi:hypothetical protein
MRNRNSASAVLLMILLLSACGAREADPAIGPGAAVDRSAVLIENSTSRTLQIYAVTAGTEVRIGTIRSMRTEEMSLPGLTANGTPFRLVARPRDTRGEAGVRSTMIETAPGHMVTWSLFDRPGVSTAPRGVVKLVPLTAMRRR